MPSGFNNVPSNEQQLVDNLLGGNLTGIISARPTAKYLSGARCILRVNSQIVGFAFAVSWRINTVYTEVNCIDNPLPEELTPRAIKVEGNISALHVPGQGPGIQLWQPDALGFLFHKYITIEVRDSTTNQLLFFTPKAVITSRQEDIRIDDLAQISLSFMAIGFRDEKTPDVPDGATTLASVNNLGDHNVEARATINPSSSLKPNLPTE